LEQSWKKNKKPLSLLELVQQRVELVLLALLQPLVFPAWVLLASHPVLPLSAPWLAVEWELDYSSLPQHL
jgi:hypothetical protein